MEKLNGIIVNGRVYEIRDRKGWNCSPCSCDLYGYCIKQDNIFNNNAPCLLSQDTIGFRYSPELTDKINKI